MKKITVSEIQKFLFSLDIDWRGDKLVVPTITYDSKFDFPCFACDKKDVTDQELAENLQPIPIPVKYKTHYGAKYSRIFYLEVSQNKFILSINKQEYSAGNRAGGIELMKFTDKSDEWKEFLRRENIPNQTHDM